MIAAEAAAEPTPGDASLRATLARAGLDWIVPAWKAPGVRAFVTTRNGDPARAQAFLPAPPAWLSQVHGASVARIDGAISPPPRADAAVTRRANVVLAVRVADCMPVLFADRRGGAVGIAHAGWRGLAKGVLEQTLAAMACDPRDAVAWLGPAIGRDAFEVGADVYDAFVRADENAARAFAPLRPGKWLADLEMLARARLARAGVAEVAGGGVCTYSDPQRFFSYRRDGSTGRMAAFLWRTREESPQLT